MIGAHDAPKLHKTIRGLRYFVTVLLWSRLGFRQYGPHRPGFSLARRTVSLGFQYRIGFGKCQAPTGHWPPKLASRVEFARRQALRVFPHCRNGSCPFVVFVSACSVHLTYPLRISQFPIRTTTQYGCVFICLCRFLDSHYDMYWDVR